MDFLFYGHKVQTVKEVQAFYNVLFGLGGC